MTASGGRRRLMAMISVAGASIGLAGAPAGAIAGAGFGALSGRGGCFVTQGTDKAEVGTGMECHVAKGLLQASAVAVSPDGANVYVAGGTPGFSPAQSFGNLAILKRDPATGAITPVGCMSSDGSDGQDGESGACTPTPSLLGADGVAVSPDGLTVYVTSESSASVVAFARDPASGSLTRLGCLQGSPRPGSPCRVANVFIGSGAVVVSADSTALYVASPGEGAITSIMAPVTSSPGAGGSPPVSPQPVSSMFTTPPAPSYLANPCIAVNGFDGACAPGIAMRGVAALALSADGKQLYGTAATSKAIDVLSVAEGGLTESGCLMVEAPAGLCASTKLMRSPTSVAPSPDGKNVYVSDSANGGGGRIDVLARNASTGQLADAGCVDFLAPPAKEEPSENTEEDAEEKRDREKELRRQKEESEKAPPDVCERVPGLEDVNVLAVSGDGSSVYAFGRSSAVTFTRDPATGKLTEASCAAAEDSRCASLPALSQVQAAAISPDGREVYVVGAGRGTVMTFSIGAAVTTARASVNRGRTARVRVACPAGLQRPCSGRVELMGLAGRRHGRKAPRARRVGLGASRHFSIAPGRQVVVRVQLSRAAQRLLRDRRRLRLTAIVRADVSAGGSGFGRHLMLTLARF
jgi:DNA-binding beta-propeller fold protein YncE